MIYDDMSSDRRPQSQRIPAKDNVQVVQLHIYIYICTNDTYNGTYTNSQLFMIANDCSLRVQNFLSRRSPSNSFNVCFHRLSFTG